MEPVAAEDGTSAQNGADSSLFDDGSGGVVSTLERSRQQSGATSVAAHAAIEQTFGDGRQTGPTAPTAVAAHHRTIRVMMKRFVSAE